MLKRFKKFRSIEADINGIQENVEEVLQPVLESQVIDGVLLKGISLTTGVDNVVSHKLGRKPQGWILVRKRAESDVWDLQDVNKTPSRTLVLRCAADVTVDLWIF